MLQFVPVVDGKTLPVDSPFTIEQVPRHKSDAILELLPVRLQHAEENKDWETALNAILITVQNPILSHHYEDWEFADKYYAILKQFPVLVKEVGKLIVKEWERNPDLELFKSGFGSWLFHRLGRYDY